MAKVNVIIPAYNCALYLSNAIDSVLKQTFQDYKIIIVDDGSIDNTKEVVDAYIQSNGTKIHYIYQDNKGVACARNAGMKNADSEYVALLDADDSCVSDRLEESVKLLDSDNDLGLVHSSVRGVYEGRPPSQKYKRKKNIETLSGYIFKNLLLRKAHICTSTVMVRKNCLEKVGLFDEKLTRLGSEDRDLWLRISRQYKVGYINKPLAYYRHRENSMSKNIEKMTQARYYVLDKLFSEVELSSIARKQAYSAIHNELSRCHLMNGEFKEAKIEMRKAFLYTPWDFSLIKLMLKAYLRLQGT